MDENDRPGLDRVAESLTVAWNAGDAVAFAKLFTDDADFVNIGATLVTGRDAILKQHQMIFSDVYRGSRIVFTLTKTRQFADGVIGAQIEAHLHVPQGPRAGELDTLATIILVREPSGWRIAALQNTLKMTTAMLDRLWPRH